MQASPEFLDLSAPIPRGFRSLHLRATGVPSGLYYRLDSIIRPGQILRWSASRVLGAVGIPMSDVGLFAFSDDEVGTPIYVPVTVGDTPPSQADETKVELRTADLVEDLRWRFILDNKTSDQPWADIDAAQDRIVLSLSPVSGMLQIGWSDPQTGHPRRVSFRIDD